jgi:SPP1 gp7 family putative phage head morphogenesis protein
MEEWGDYEFEGMPDITEGRLKKIIDREAKRLAKSYNDTTANLLKSAINDGIQAGDSIPQIAERVAAVYEFSDTYRAMSVAHTETFYVANEANREAYRQSGLVEEIRWVTAEDEIVCEFCGPLNEKIISIKDNFYDKGQTVQGRDGGKLSMDYRNMDNPPLHPNCRCFIQAVVKDISELSATPSSEKDIDSEELAEDIANLIDL